MKVIKFRRVRWMESLARMGRIRNTYKILVVKPYEKRPAGKLRRKWKANIKMDLRKIWFVVMNWINVAQDRDRRQAFVNTAMNVRIT
jgi:hypothetical protein